MDLSNSLVIVGRREDSPTVERAKCRAGPEGNEQVINVFRAGPWREEG